MNHSGCRQVESTRKLEQDLAEILERSSSWRVPIPRWGASDSHRRRTSHLFDSMRRPSFRRFQQKANRAIGEPIELEQDRLAQDDSAAKTLFNTR